MKDYPHRASQSKPNDDDDGTQTWTCRENCLLASKMVVVVALLLNLTHIYTKTTATAQSDLGRTTHDDDDNDAGG